LKFVYPIRVQDSKHVNDALTTFKPVPPVQNMMMN